MALYLQRISQAEAFQFIERVHRHHKKPRGWRFGIAAHDGERILGVITVGRPVAKVYDEEVVAEVNRCACISPRDGGVRNVPSFLYTAASRATQAMGFRALMTAILKGEEHGSSLRAAAWQFGWDSEGGSWGSDSRPRDDKHPTGPKEIWVPHWSDDPRKYKKGEPHRLHVPMPPKVKKGKAEVVAIGQMALFDGLTG